MATNKLGRDYSKAVGISKDLRSLIVQEIIERGGNSVTGEVPRGVITAVAEKFKVVVQTVSNVWKRYLSTGDLSESRRNTQGRPKLTEPDVRMIQFLKQEAPSVTGREVLDKLKKVLPRFWEHDGQNNQ